MNALQKDLKKLTALAEAAGAARPRDRWRPEYHLSPPVGWLNDPNGLCYFRGEYHVFYQYAPFSPEGGVKFWGHYKSPDLLRWEQRPVMLYSDQPFDVHGAYSGSALCGEDGLYLYYTGNVKHAGDYDYIREGRGHNTVLAWSPDGVTLGWKRLLLENQDYPAGLTCHVRDPKVWKQDGRYYMVQGARTLDDEGVLLVFESENRLDWRHINTLRAPAPFGYMWECPDLFELDGRWFLLVSPQGAPAEGPGFENVYACGYFPLEGDFRGGARLGAFTPLDFGFDFYAPQTFTDGARRLLIGWQGMPDAPYTNPTAELGWQHCLTLPRELGCKNGKLTQRPARELERLREGAREYRFQGEARGPLGRTAEIVAEGGALRAVDLGGLSLDWRDGLLTLAVREGGYGRETRAARVERLDRLHIFLDASAVEIFVNDGETVLSTRWYPGEGERELTLTGDGTATVYGRKPFELRQTPGGFA